jgi:DNA-binding MarR family transcriptional regulator
MTEIFEEGTGLDEFHKRAPYQLVLLGNRLNAVNSRYYMSKLGVGVIEGRILSALHDNLGRSASEVCSILGLDQAAASRAIRGLERRGLVEVSPDRGDARRRVMLLTKDGSALRRTLIEHLLRRTDLALTGFSPGERLLLGEFIDRLMENVNLLDRDD